MISFLGCSAQGIAVASGVTTVALLERLVERNILTRADARAAKAGRRLSDQCIGTPRTREAFGPIRSGEMIDANEAHRIGLVEKVVPRAELMTEAKRLANVIASKAPLAIAACKRVINGGAHLPIDDALELEALAFGTTIGTHDFKEGTAAFLEKRKANWESR